MICGAEKHNFQVFRWKARIEMWMGGERKRAGEEICMLNEKSISFVILVYVH